MMSQQKTNKSFAYASRETIKMATPLVGSRLINASCRLIAMLMIAWLGKEALAAGALITTMRTTLIMLIISLIYSVGVVIGRAYGEGDIESIGDITHQGLVLVVLASIPVIIVMLFIKPILLFLGQEPHIVELTSQFFFAAIFGVIPSACVVCLNQFLTGISRPRICLISAIITLPLRLSLSYVLLFGRFGFPRIGIAGVAYADAIVGWLWLGCLLSYLFLSPYYKRFHLFRFSKFVQFDLLKHLFSIGWPISVQFVAELLAWSFCTFMMGWLGGAVLAAQQIVLQCGLVVVMVPFGISQASAVLVGQAVGQKDYNMTKHFGYAAMVWSGVFMILIGCVYLIAPKSLIGLFLNLHQPEQLKIIHIAILLLALSAFIQVFDAIRNVFTGALRGFHDTKIPMAVGVLSMWVINLPLGYIMAFWFHWGPVGLYIAGLLGAIIGAWVLWRRFNWHVDMMLSTQ